MAEPKLTPWFSPSVKPVRRGVYETRDDRDSFYQHWDGRAWNAICDNPAEAYDWTGFDSLYQDHEWRGLAKEPK